MAMTDTEVNTCEKRRADGKIATRDQAGDQASQFQQATAAIEERS